VGDEERLFALVDEEAQGAGGRIEIRLQHHRRQRRDEVVAVPHAVSVPHSSVPPETGSRKRKDDMEQGGIRVGDSFGVFLTRGSVLRENVEKIREQTHERRKHVFIE
jgi:hypothetical protein